MNFSKIVVLSFLLLEPAVVLSFLLLEPAHADAMLSFSAKRLVGLVGSKVQLFTVVARSTGSKPVDDVLGYFRSKDKPGMRGETPLMRAAFLGDVEAARIAMEAGANHWKINPNTTKFAWEELWDLFDEKHAAGHKFTEDDHAVAAMIGWQPDDED